MGGIGNGPQAVHSCDSLHPVCNDQITDEKGWMGGA